MDLDSMYNYDLNETIPDPYENYVDNLSSQEEWTRWGQKGFKKPKASDIWITPEFDIKPTINPAPQCLDEYDLKPVFSVVSKQYQNCIPTCVHELLIDSNIMDNDLETATRKHCSNNIAVVSRTKSSVKAANKSSVECSPGTSRGIDGQSGHSLPGSFENLAIVGCSASFPQPKEVVYFGNPTVYRKSDDVQIEKNGRDRKAKKAMKQQKKKKDQYVVIEETKNDLNHIMPLDVMLPKKYMLNISQPPNEQRKTYSDYAAKPKVIHEFLEHFQHDSEPQHINLTVDFPTLGTAELPVTNGYVESSDSVIYEGDEPFLVRDDPYMAEEPCSFLAIENIPLSVDDDELNDFIMMFGEVVIIDQKECGDMLSLKLKVKDSKIDAQWIADCIDGYLLFGECSAPVRCYITRTGEF